jgi:hypothetical protein
VHHIHVVPGVRKVGASLLNGLSAIIDQRVQKAAENDVKVSWIGWRTDSFAEVTFTALDFTVVNDSCMWIFPSGFANKECIVDVIDEHYNVDEMNDGTEHVLSEGESLPLEVDQIHHKICGEN